MTSSYDIEKAILVSVLENEFIGNNKEIINVELNPSHFTDEFHIMLVNGINRLKELDMPVNTDFLREQYMKVNKWNISHDNKMIEIMVHNPIGSLSLFSKYIKQLERNFIDSFDRRLAI